MPLVRSRYHQSKADTSTISSWLARAAVQAGYPLTNFDVSAHPLLAGQDGGIIKTAKHAKKNAKRNAKKKANKKLQRQKEEGADGQEDDAGDANDDVHDDAKPSVATPAQGEVQTGEVRSSVAAVPLAEVQPGSYIIRVHQYVEIAEFLVEKEVEIPIELLQLIRRCIGLRLSTLKRYLPDPDLSTYTHEYFIDVLRQVGSILHEAREAALLRKLSANSKPKTRDQPASNRFATLADFTTDDADTQDNDDQEPAVIHLEQPRNGPETAVSVAEIDFDVVDTTDEMIMDVLIFLDDIRENRSFIHKLWAKYGMGQRDLVTVSVTTNTALEVLKKTNDELMKRILPHFGGDFQGLWLATIAYISERHYDRDHLDGYTWSGDVKADDLYHQHLYESLMVPTWEVMEIFTLKKNHGKGYNQYDVSKGLFNPSLNPFTMETPQRWEQARYLLEETYMDYHFIHSGLKRTQQWASHQTAHNSRSGVRPPFIDAIYEDDEMARSIGSIIDTGKCTLHDVTCAQIFVDINFILLSGTQRAHDELRQAATQMKLTIEEYQRVEAEIDGRPSDYALQNESLRKDLEMRASEDDIVNCMKDELMSLHPTIQRIIPRRMLFQRSPLLCGVVLFRLYLIFQDFGLAVANKWDVVWAMCHLYHACKTFGVERPESFPSWPDLDFAMEQYDKVDMFAGKVPTTAEDARICFMQAENANITLLRSLRNGTRPPSSLKDCYRPVRAGHDYRKLQQRTSSIVSLFRDRFIRPDSRRDVDIGNIEAFVTDLVAREEHGQLKGKALKKARKTKTYKLEQLLTVLATGLDGEMQALKFNTCSLHLRCLHVLQKVYNALIVQPGFTFRTESPSQVVSTVGVILFDAGEAEMAFRMLAGQEAVAGARKCPWLLTAVNTLSQFLQDTGEGGAELRNVAPYVGQLPDEKGKLEVGRRSVALDFIGFNADMYELKVAERRLIREQLCAEFMPDLLQTLERNGLPSDHPDLLKMVRDNVEKELDDRYLTKLGPGVRVNFDEGEGDDSKRPNEGDPIKFITKQLREAATI